jgi:hypothetical protein
MLWRSEEVLDSFVDSMIYEVANDRDVGSNFSDTPFI